MINNQRVASYTDKNTVLGDEYLKSRLIYKLIFLIVEKKWSYISCLLVIIFFGVCAITIAHKQYRHEAILNSKKVVVSILRDGASQINNDLIISDKALSDYISFKKNFDLTAIKLYSALTQYKKYDYIVIPRSSSIKPFLITIQEEAGRKHIFVTNEGIERFISNYRRKTREED